MARLWRDSRLKRALFGGVLLVYLVASLGLLPSPDLLSRWFGYAISEPFPCQSHSCGCATAQQCWTSCCCNTPHQRLVWAVRNGVNPPSSVRYTEADWAAAATDAAAETDHCSLCDAGVAHDQPVTRSMKTRTSREMFGECGPITSSEIAHSKDRAAPALSTNACETASAPDASCCTSVSSLATLPSASPLSCKGLNPLLAFALPTAPPLAFAALLPPPPRLPPFDRPENEAIATRTLDVAAPPPRVGVVIG
ncbi:MAG: hypothetical protein KF912_10080 [Phycisphaeraceae bacterium]|nr:hypothetical protein [Phycisphaeraceae bacterium]MBX3367644.1 hypothetical protein [Phycisphaeraceae bacterium]